MPDATDKLKQEDHLFFTKIRVRGPDVTQPKGVRGQTGQHGMRTYTYKNGAFIVDKPRDQSEQWTFTLEEEATGKEPEPEAWSCPYETCPYDAAPFTEPWRLAKEREEQARKESQAANRERQQAERDRKEQAQRQKEQERRQRTRQR